MKVKFSHDGEAKEWDYNPDEVLSKEAESIERVFGDSWDRFNTQLQAGSMKARRVLLWHLQKRDHAQLKFQDLPDFPARALSVDYSIEELTDMLARLAKVTPKTEEESSEKETISKLIQSGIDELVAVGEPNGPKAP